MGIHPLKRNNQGNVLLVSLFVVFIASAMVAGFATMLKQETNLSARSQAWNQAMPASEAGIEDAFELVNFGGTPWGWTNSLITNGWSKLSNNMTSLSRNIDEISSYTVTITSNSTSLQFDSIGFVKFTANGIATNLARKVQVIARLTPSLPYGLVTSNAISLSGNTVIDSFDSRDSKYSTGGRYDPAKAHDQVTVATGSSSSKAIQLSGSSRVYGNLLTGPGGNASLNGNSRAGDMSFVGPSGGWPPGVEEGHLKDNFIFSYTPPAYTPPPAGGDTLSSLDLLPTTTYMGTKYNVSADGTVYRFSTDLRVSGGSSKPLLVTGNTTNIVTENFIMGGNGYMVVDAGANYTLYALKGFSLGGGPPSYSITINANATVNIYAPNGFTVDGSASIYIAPGSHLNIYAGGSVKIAGAGLINGANAKDLNLYGLPNCTDITITGSGNFIGSVFAPTADFTLSGGSPFVGSCVARSASLQGSGAFHFDEALKDEGPTLGYTAVRWQEVKP